MRTTTEYQMVVFNRHGKKIRTYQFKTRERATHYADSYKTDRLGRTATVQERGVMTTPWREIV